MGSESVDYEAHTIHHYFGLRHSVWEPFKFGDQDEVSVSEIWQDANLVDRRTVHRSVYNYDVPSWLERTEHGEKSTVNPGSSCILRAVWVGSESKSRIKVDQNAFKQIMHAFQLETAQDSTRSAYANIAQIAGHATQFRCYIFSNYPKISMTWSVSKSGMINVLCIAERVKSEVLQDLFSSKFVQRLSHLEVIPALLCAILYSKEVDERLEDVKKLVREVEARTGYHEFSSRNEIPARGNLLDLAAKMSGCGTKIASHVRKIGVLQELNKFVVVNANATTVNVQVGKDDPNQAEIVENIRILEQRIALQQVDAEYVRCRVQTQRDALFHIIAENDAALSHEIAKDSKILALASQRDSASMKSLAIVSMMFLPGTFVSSLFGMPLFDWGPEVSMSEAQRVEIWGPRLGLFLAVTAPLMLLTFFVWTWWIRRQKGKTERQFKTAQVQTHAQLENDIPPSEVRALALKKVNSAGSEEVFGAIATH